MTARKDIAKALLTKLTTGGQFAKFGRTLRSPEQAAAPGKPALYLTEPTEHVRYDNDDATTPAVREMEFEVIVYTSVVGDQTAVPADIGDDLLDAIDTALAPTPADQLQYGARQTLGGLVYNCRVDGTIDLAPGDKDGLGGYRVPIRVIL